MQTVMTTSGKRFTIEKQSDPVEFFSWLLNTLHLGLTNGKRKRASIITRCFQGELQITTEAGTGAAPVVAPVRKPTLTGLNQPSSPIVTRCFQGEVQITITKACRGICGRLQLAG